MAFLEAGAAVVTTYRRAEEFAALVSSAETIRATPPDGAVVDVTGRNGGRAIRCGHCGEAQAPRHSVNTVGGYAGGRTSEVDPRTYDQMLQLNLKAGLFWRGRLCRC